jgi:hypothetical protein
MKLFIYREGGLHMDVQSYITKINKQLEELKQDDIQAKDENIEAEVPNDSSFKLPNEE